PTGAGLRDSRSARRVPLIVLTLVLVTVALYSPVGQYDFIYYDDPGYVSENPHVARGLSWSSLRWAFTTGHESNWHPLTWLSHMVDCQLFGLKPGPAPLVNLLFHTLNAALLFQVLRRLTGSLWRSALAAALFAWHPLQIHSVAWISERKNVLRTLFWLLAIWQYARYVQRPTKANYGLLAACVALGLMSKPMVVTLPCVLLLLDFWPLGRWPREAFTSSATFRATLGRLVGEKWPLFLLVALSCVVTILVQRAGGAVARLDNLPLQDRITNALVSYPWYAWKTFWPADLCVIYPMVRQPMWRAGGAFVVLAAVSLLAFRLAWRQPWFFVGWFLFLGTLVPVIGILQVGLQSHADRYMYIPGIGLFILIVWGIDTWLPAVRRHRGAAAGAAGVLLSGMLAATALHLPHWHDGESIMQRALAVTRNNIVAHDVLGIIYQKQGRLDEASRHLTAALRIDPRCVSSLNGMSHVLITQ
ncbi:MAG: glycosyltransferase family 39 protein, partial [Pedosphaera parvula]|nr:glycosyltransferase family 39 protein [Pedosphaera parvula]